MNEYERTGRRLAEFQKLAQRQSENRDRMADHDDPETMAAILYGEVVELQEQLVESQLSGDANKVAKELGDCFIALTKVARLCGIDLITAGLMKLDRNAVKYADHRFNNGYVYDDSIEVGRRIWDKDREAQWDEDYLLVLSDHVESIGDDS